MILIFVLFFVSCRVVSVCAFLSSLEAPLTHSRSICHWQSDKPATHRLRGFIFCKLYLFFACVLLAKYDNLICVWQNTEDRIDISQSIDLIAAISLLFFVYLYLFFFCLMFSAWSFWGAWFVLFPFCLNVFVVNFIKIGHLVLYFSQTASLTFAFRMELIDSMIETVFGVPCSVIVYLYVACFFLYYYLLPAQ